MSSIHRGDQWARLAAPAGCSALTPSSPSLGPLRLLGLAGALALGHELLLEVLHHVARHQQAASLSLSRGVGRQLAAEEVSACRTSTRPQREHGTMRECTHACAAAIKQASYHASRLALAACLHLQHAGNAAAAAAAALW